MDPYTSSDSFFDVQDGDAPIDLWCSGTINTMSTTPSIIKRGLGVMRLTGTGSPFNEKNVYVNAGTLLVDNASGAGTGKATARVAAGATLSGTGFIGGVATYSNANVIATGASGNLAVIAPGTIDPTSGAHIYGTLHVGSATQTNNVTFGNYSQFRVAIGKNRQADQLDVYGSVDLSSLTDNLMLTVDPDAKGGIYTLISATEGITGTFNTLAVDFPKPGQLSYTATTVDYNIVNSTVIVVR